MGVFISGEHVPLHIKMRLLQLYVNYFDIIEVRLMVARILAEVQGLEDVGLF